ncbi:MAG: acyltransferase family protein [Acidimicrobiales bacterium]
MTITHERRDDLFVFEDPPPPPEAEEPGGRRIPYVPALDGLRGVAVLAVVLYHAEFGLFGHQLALGGFLGVDAFFVLSGFLITGLLLSEWTATGTLAFGRFWAHRAKRLLPALFLTLFGVALYSQFLAGPDVLDQLRRDSIWSMFYAANWHFVLSDSSYFAMFAFKSPLQHMWSLAIEEQWYLIWPPIVFLVLRWKRSPRAVLWLSVGLCVASMVWMALLFAPGKDPSRVYYGTDTRAQSLLVGAALAAAVACGLRVTTRNGRLALNTAAVAVSAVLAWFWVRTPDTAEWLYTGGFLFLALGVGLIIFTVTQAGDEPNPVRTVLSWTPLRALGLISYGVYLYHWPLFVVLNPERTGLTGLGLLVLRLVVTLAVATASYFFVEKPIRYGHAIERIHAFRVHPLWLPAGAAMLLLGLVVFTTKDARATLAFTQEKDASLRPPPSVTGPGDAAAPETAKVILFGDSVAWTMGQGFDEGADENGDNDVAERNGLAVWNQAVLFCELVQGPRTEKDKELPGSDTCANWEGDWSRAVDQFQPDLTVLQVGAWEIYDRKIDGRWVPFGSPEYDAILEPTLQHVADVLTRTGKPLVLLTTPHFERNDGVSPEEWTQNDRSRTDHFNEVLRRVAAANPDKVRIVDFGGWLCPPDQPCRETIDGVVMRSDGLHFEAPGAQKSAEWLAPQLRAIANGG